MPDHRPFTADQVRIVDFPPTPVAIMEHAGDPATLGDTIRAFIAWRKRTGLRPDASATFTIFPVDPEAAAPDAVRIQLCAATNGTMAWKRTAPGGVVEGLIPGGRCAVLRLVGASDALSAAATYLHKSWLPGSREQARDYPLYAQRISFFPDVAEHKAVTDLFLPLR